MTRDLSEFVLCHPCNGGDRMNPTWQGLPLREEEKGISKSKLAISLSAHFLVLREGNVYTHTVRILALVLTV